MKTARVLLACTHRRERDLNAERGSSLGQITFSTDDDDDACGVWGQGEAVKCVNLPALSRVEQLPGSGSISNMKLRQVLAIYAATAAALSEDCSFFFWGFSLDFGALFFFSFLIEDRKIFALQKGKSRDSCKDETISPINSNPEVLKANI